MYQKMLVPLDGSELAEVVFPYAREFAVRLGLEVLLLLVSPSGSDELLPMRRAYIEHAAEITRREAREARKRVGIEAAGRRIAVKGEVAVGYPPEEILRYADEHNVDFIIMATHGLSGISRWVIGSVAEKVLRASKVPVLLVRAGVPDEIVYDKWPKRTLLVLLDGSELAESVLPHVEVLAKQRTPPVDEVVLLRVCEPPVPPSSYADEPSAVPWNWGQIVEQELAREKQAATQYLARVQKQLSDKGINVQSVTLVGKAADEIVEYVKKNPFNLIVMATHGRSGLSRLVYGSVADSILHGVNSPILLVRSG